MENQAEISREREKEVGKQLLEFSNLFSTYKEKLGGVQKIIWVLIFKGDWTKVSEENKVLQSENALLRQHARLLQAKIDIWQDIMIKIHANQKRKENLEKVSWPNMFLLIENLD